MKQNEDLVSLKKTRKSSETNIATRRIIEFLTFDIGAFVWRSNVLPIPVRGGGLRPGSKKGLPDIVGISFMKTIARMLDNRLKNL